ncbi:MAG TPA: HAD-IIIA family hydrolase [Steroidobacteraceae bacterium]|nr:HAD-IIIA family hydrolase [Steroidobacteraceae bacterium]
MAYRHLILDRDGVLNDEAPDSGYVQRPEDFRWLPGACSALALLHRAGIRISVATNQSGVGRGLMSLEDLQRVHAKMLADAAARGGPLDAVLSCAHAPEARCSCRKPEPGLILAAIERSGIPASESLVVGDDERDLEAAARAGIDAALVLTGKGRRTVAQLSARPRTGDRPMLVFDDLEALARSLVRGGALRPEGQVGE